MDVRDQLLAFHRQRVWLDRQWDLSDAMPAGVPKLMRTMELYARSRQLRREFEIFYQIYERARR